MAAIRKAIPGLHHRAGDVDFFQTAPAAEQPGDGVLATAFALHLAHRRRP
jgi:hypothetical protein